MKRTVSLVTILGAVIFPVAVTFAQPSLTKIDINPNGSSSPEMLTTALNKLYFFADNGVAGKELMVCDGANVSLVADLVPGAGGLSDLSNICELNGKIYFAAQAPGLGTELFEYDGVNPPMLAKDVVAGALSSYPSDLVAFDTLLYFRARISPTDPSFGIYSYSPATGNAHLRIVSDKPDEGTELTVYKNKLCFSSKVGQGLGRGLFQFNPPLNLVDTLLTVEPSDGRPFGYLVDSGVLYFCYSKHAGHELYRYDGTTAAQKLTDFPGAQGIVYKSKIARMQGQIFMFATGPTVTENILAVYDESTGQTKLLDTSYYAGWGFGVYNNRMYVSLSNAMDLPVYTYNGLTLRLLSDFVSSAQSVGIADGHQVFQGNLFFTAFVSGADRELYRFNDANMSVKSETDFSASLVYPNPVSSKATISFTLKQNAELNIQLTDMQGRVVYAAEIKQHSPGRNEIKIPVQQLATGGYIYSVVNSEGEIVCRGKLIKD
jgi:ELWxxDGT repeat protein